MSQPLHQNHLLSEEDDPVGASTGYSIIFFKKNQLFFLRVSCVCVYVCGWVTNKQHGVFTINKKRLLRGNCGGVSCALWSETRPQVFFCCCVCVCVYVINLKNHPRKKVLPQDPYFRSSTPSFFVFLLLSHWHFFFSMFPAYFAIPPKKT